MGSVVESASQRGGEEGREWCDKSVKVGGDGGKSRCLHGHQLSCGDGGLGWWCWVDVNVLVRGIQIKDTGLVVVCKLRGFEIGCWFYDLTNDFIDLRSMSLQKKRRDKDDMLKLYSVQRHCSRCFAGDNRLLLNKRMKETW